MPVGVLTTDYIDVWCNSATDTPHKIRAGDATCWAAAVAAAMAARTSWGRACLPAPFPWSSAISSSDLGNEGLLTFVITSHKDCVDYRGDVGTLDIIPP